MSIKTYSSSDNEPDKVNLETPVPSKKTVNRVTFSELEDEIREAIHDLYENTPPKKRKFETHEEIYKALKKSGIQASFGAVYRVFNKIKMHKKNGYYELNANTERKANLRKLKTSFQQFKDMPDFFKSSEFDIAILWTESGYSALLAIQISDAFSDEVLSTICPNDSEIIIFYRRQVKPTKANPSGAIKMVAALEKLCKKTENKSEGGESPIYTDTKESELSSPA